MSVVLAATVDRKSKSFTRELAALKERCAALMKQHPDKQLVTGKREEGSKLHLTVMLSQPAKRTATAADAGNYIVSSPTHW